MDRYLSLCVSLSILLFASITLNFKDHFSTHLKPNHRPLILFWTLFYNEPWPINGERHCGEYTCDFTSNKKLFYNSSALIFSPHGRHFMSDVLFAKSFDRPPWQRWVFADGESPMHSPVHHFLKGQPLFNWSVSYRLDSDVRGVYGITFPGQFRNGFDRQRNYLEGKTIDVSALISNCAYDRLKLVWSLMKYININLMGTCNGKWLSFNDSHSQIRRSKFYLAFENSLCVDYVTEKLYKNGYMNGAVPVIVSGANLSNPLIVPPGSYIDATKFKSAKELADYLKYVGSSKERYNKFFEWRDKWNINATDWAVMCNLCKKLHESSPEDTKVYTDLSNLYVKEKECIPYFKW